MLECIEMLKCRPIHNKLWMTRRQLDAQFWLLDARTQYCKFADARQSAGRCLQLMEDLESIQRDSPDLKDSRVVNRSMILSHIAILDFHMGDYAGALQRAVKSLECWQESCPVKTTIDILRHASRALMARRKFNAAGLLIKHAVQLTRQHFDDARTYPSPLYDFGYYLLNVDLVEAAAGIFERAFEYRQRQFHDGLNLRMAQAHEDLAHSLYIREYSTGSFDKARQHAERAMSMLDRLLPADHYIVSSCKRVKALILEEMAIDSNDKTTRERLLVESEQLHLSSLRICSQILGADNLQTAKHCGNLGRLYQSAERLQEAEQMHQRAIEIKQRLLGAEDDEVSMSMGHLASLYNYDMAKYAEAEQLYLQSIKIGIKSFGGAYSSLEYYYRGLIHLYSAQGHGVKAAEYMQRLTEWHRLREHALVQHSTGNVWDELASPPVRTKTVINQVRNMLKMD